MMKMKRVLLIASSCYPVNGAEEIVNIKMLQAFKHSKMFKVDLISRKRKWELYPSAKLDEYDVDVDSLHVIEVDNRKTIKTFCQHLKSLFHFGVVFHGSHWAAEALPLSIKLYKSNEYDYVLTKSESSFLIGYYLKKHYGAKWVATWNDPYPVVMNPIPYGKGLHYKGNFFWRKVIQIMEKYVDVHVFPNDRLRNYMLQYLNINIDKTIIIPHVVINNTKTEDVQRTADGKIRIIHSGKLANPRNPESFFIGLSRFIKENGENKLILTIQGSVDNQVKELIDKYNLSNVVEIKPPVTYKESLISLKDYHIALIIEANIDEGIFLPTKVSDFMQSKKKIFSVSPRIGVLNDLYENGYISYFASVDNPDEIYKQLRKIYDDFNNCSNDKLDLCPDFLEQNVVSKYLSI